jgi:NAD(P)H-hydrate epimerase
MTSLPAPVHAAATVRAADRQAIEVLGLPGYLLMTRAGEAAFALLRRQWPLARRLLVLAGPGNNGGDAYVLARLARAAGLEVVLVAPAGAPAAAGDALRARSDWADGGGFTTPWSRGLLGEADVVVDGLLGTGLARDVGEPYAALIAALNAADRPVLALDLPSGLDADSGQVRGSAVRAALTVTFVGLKAGLYLGDGPDHVGRLAWDGLGVPVEAFGAAVPLLRRITAEDVRRLLPRRARTANKGSHGRVLIIGGGPGMPGAVRLAGEAALRAGAGLVTVATSPAHAAIIAGGRPELICLPTEDAASLHSALEAADVVAIGPGLGRSPWARGLVEAAFACGRPLVVDADALNLLAERPRRGPAWCLTPHPGEAGRLLGSSAAAVQADRLAAVHALVERYGGVVVLKGAGTLVATAGEPPQVCDRGNPGMAAAGMGDVLTGVIAAVVAQQRDPVAALAAAAAVGVAIHAAAGDLAARAGERGLIASDVIASLPSCVNPAP